MAVFLAQTVPQLQSVVEMRDLTMQWGPRPVLDRVNLTLRAGERLAVVGPSGAGKSTVLRLLAGLQLPTSGELSLFNQPQTYLRLDQNDPPDVRLVFQNPALLASLTVEENVGFLLRERAQLSRQEIRDRVHACLEAVGLYDEPTAGLDPVACTRIEDLIVKTTTVAQGCSVVVSHVRSTIERSAQRVVMLYGGRFQWEGSVDAFRSTDNPYVVQFRTGSLRGPMQPAEH